MMKVESEWLCLLMFRASPKSVIFTLSLFIDEDVGRLDVAVHDPLTVGVVEGHAALEDDADGAMDRQQAFEIAVPLEGVAREVLHDHVGFLAGYHRLEDLYDVGVIEALRDGLLGLEQLEQAAIPLGLVPGLVVEADVLDRQRIGVERTLREIYGRGRASPYLANDPVLANFLRRSRHLNPSSPRCRALNIDTAIVSRAEPR